MGGLSGRRSTGGGLSRSAVSRPLPSRPPPSAANVLAQTLSQAGLPRLGRLLAGNADMHLSRQQREAERRNLRGRAGRAPSAAAGSETLSGLMRRPRARGDADGSDEEEEEEEEEDDDDEEDEEERRRQSGRGRASIGVSDRFGLNRLRLLLSGGKSTHARDTASEPPTPRRVF